MGRACENVSPRMCGSGAVAVAVAEGPLNLALLISNLVLNCNTVTHAMFGPTRVS